MVSIRPSAELQFVCEGKRIFCLFVEILHFFFLFLCKNSKLLFSWYFYDWIIYKVVFMLEVCVSEQFKVWMFACVYIFVDGLFLLLCWSPAAVDQ